MQGRESKDPLVTYLKEIEDRNIFPKGMGFVRRRSNINDLNLKSFYIRDEYVEAIKKGLSLSTVISIINLDNVGLNSKRAIAILEGIQI